MVLNLQAEIIPNEPDAGNAVVGRSGKTKTRDPLSLVMLNRKKTQIMKFLVLAAAMLLSAFTYAQNQLIGQILDNETNQPIPGATISLKNGKQVTISDADGKFQFSNLAEGSCSIRVSFVGYTTEEQKINLPAQESIIFKLVPRVIMEDKVVVRATRASDETPMTFQNIDKQQLEKENTGKDFPYLLESTASVVTTSDAGSGVGYTGVRIRGSDATRVNVTLNGIPYNDSESQGVYWVDLPDIASSVESVQVQRGVGTSTNGAGAFGASINIQTTGLNEKPYAQIDNSFGTFNTHKHTLSAGTGLINNAFTIDGRVSKIASDGYIDRASSDLTSYYLSGGYYGKNSMLRLNIFSGHEITYQSWYGTPESRIKNDVQGMQEYIQNYYLDAEDSANLLSSGRTYNYYTYDNQVDDYTQTHYQLLYAWDVTPDWTLNTALHYTKGYGYYEEYKKYQDFDDYGFDRPVVGTDTIYSMNLIRRKWLDNDFYGMTFSLEYKPSNQINVVLGGAWNQYDGDHYGEIIWSQFAGNTSIRDGYYQNNGLKTDFNSYAKLSWVPLTNLTFFGDLQYRWVSHALSGIDSDRLPINEVNTYNFLNPKMGITYQLSNNSLVYASFSVGNKEPNRSDFVDSPDNQTPKPETLRDIEAGFKKKSETMWLNANFYYMDYKNQLVLTGQLNDVGSPLRTNVDKSYRAGIELEGRYDINPTISVSANATFSKNIIQSYNEVLYDYGVSWDEYNEVATTFNNTSIAFSPSLVAGGSLIVHPVDGLEIAWVHKYVGKQYLDNTSNESRKLDAYYVSDARASYGFSALGMERIFFNIAVYNLFNNLYESNGYTWGYIGGGTEYHENFYYPQAGAHFMAGLTIKL